MTRRRLQKAALVEDRLALGQPERGQQAARSLWKSAAVVSALGEGARIMQLDVTDPDSMLVAAAHVAELKFWSQRRH